MLRPNLACRATTAALRSPNATASAESSVSVSRARRAHGKSNSYMSFSTDPNGPWSAPVKIFEDYKGGDTNFAPLILSNGSMVAMWRHWGGTRTSSRGVCACAVAVLWLYSDYAEIVTVP